MTRRCATLSTVFASLIATMTAPTASAQPVSEKPDKVLGEDDQLYSCKSRTGEVSVTFKPETEVKDLLPWVMGFTCKNFVLDPRIVATGKKVTIIAPNKMSATEAYRLFLVALSTINYTLVPKGNVIKVVDSGTARQQTVPFLKNGMPDNTEQVVRYVFRPTYAQPDSLLTGFTALKSDIGDIQVIGSMLMITDYGSHVRDMMSLAKLIDVPKGSDGIYTIAVKYADAVKLVDQLTAFLGASASAPPLPAGKNGDPGRATLTSAAPSKIMADGRTNTLIIAASQAGYDRVKALVDRIDIPLDIEGGTAFHIYRLGSAVAEELSKTINDAIQGQGQSHSSTTTKGGAAAAVASPAVDTAAIEGQVRVIGDKPTNSLIVMSSGRDYLAVKDMIKQLDLPRRQVYIEAVIMEVQIGDSLDIGSSSHMGIPTKDGALMLGGVQMPQLSSTKVGSLGNASGLIGGILGPALANSTSILGTSIPSYGLLFQALGKTSNTNILSAPSIIGVDNAEAKYKVGINIPYKRGTTFSANNPVSNDQIERKPLLLELSITPHISTDDSVLLEVKHDSEDLNDTDSELGPTWTTRSFETRVVVHDQQTVVVGGLIQERQMTSTAKVPLLGDIPILGHLFKYTNKVKRKTNLVILLTPYIVKSQMDLQIIRERKMREHDELARSFGVLNGMKYNPKLDYTRKRGIVEEINRVTLAVEEDIAARDAFHKQPVVETGPLQYGNPTDDVKP